MARDYSKGKVYCIKVNTEEEYLPYIGSTTKQYLSQRMDKHRNSFKQWKNNRRIFMSSFNLFQNYGIENCYIELLELFPCSCNEELRKKEREWFDKINCVNIKKPFISNEEIVEYHKIRNIEYNKLHPERNKKYYEKYKKQILEKNKEKYECQCGSICRIAEKSTHEKTKKHQYYLSTIGTLCSTTVTETS